MPYTPPSKSPVSSAPSTPDVSRRPSLQPGASRPFLPRSASYILRSRRSLPAPSFNHVIAPTLTSNDSQARSHMDTLKVVIASDSVRQSPPPVTGEQIMPTGAIISPPESASDASDEESALEVRGRLDKSKVKELKDVISQIQQRTISPERITELASLSLPSSLKHSIEKSLSATSLADLKAPLPPSPGRKMGHVRSVTDPNASLMKTATESSVSTSEEESDSEILNKPQMVRKKSGELVRPAIRLTNRRRPSSMPGTPTFSKAVHFDSHLEHVRHFLQVDRPLAVSAGSSPNETYDSDTEYPFPGSDDKTNDSTKPRTPPYEWELNLRNFPAESPPRIFLPVRLERVWLSPPDQKSLIGSVAVANLSFHKSVVCRFTFDYWKTTSEVTADYSQKVLPKQTEAGCDRFTFSIKLSDTANLENKTLYLCVRYNVAGKEFWDNNSGVNFQIDFKKKHLPQNGKNNFQGASSRPAGSLPRSNRKSAPPAASRLQPAPSSTRPDEFGDKSKLNFDQPLHEVLGESGSTGLRFKTKSTSSLLPSDNLSDGLGAPSGQAFGTRYDFGASLEAAKKDRKDDALWMKPIRRGEVPVHPQINGVSVTQPSKPVAETGSPVPGTGSPIPGTSSPTLGLGLSSNSYEELVSRYCFFGSKQSSPTFREGAFRGGNFDGAGYSFPIVAGGLRPTSYSPTQHAGPAQHHSLPRDATRDSNSYFPAYTLRAAASPPSALGSPERNVNAPDIDRAQGSSSSPRTTVTLQSSPGGPLRSTSPTSLVGSFQPFAGASPTEEYSFAHHLQDRFPFTTDAHSATAIRG